MAAKNIEEQETPFTPVPYETTDIRTSITLLSSLEKDVVIRALNTLAKYTDLKDLNVVFLYKNGIVPKLLKLVPYSDLTIMRFTLKILAQVVTTVPESTKELSSEQFNSDVKQVAYLFMSVEDAFVKEFCSQFLAHVVKNTLMASSLLRMGITVSIFTVLNATQDPDTQLNTLVLFNNILEAREASYVLPNTVEFSLKTILCYFKSKIPEIRESALNITEKLTTWRSNKMQEMLREELIVEKLFKLILNNDYKLLHKKCFNIILTCVECLATATYFVKSLEFIQFCDWVKTCPKKHILPSATILTSLTRFPELRQVLFDFVVEDSILSFFRINNELVFYKTCEAIINMSSHRFCCAKIVTPIVIECIIGTLYKLKVPIVPFHEIALKTLLSLLKRNSKTLEYVVGCGGLDPIMDSLLREKEQYTGEGLKTLMHILYVFSVNRKSKLIIMNSLIFSVLLERLDESSEYSLIALIILDQYVEIQEYRQCLLELDGPRRLLKILTSTPSDQLFKNILIYLKRLFVYKKIGMAFLYNNSVQILEDLPKELKDAISLINQLISMMYDLYLPLKFQKLGRLEITDHLSNRFYLINGICSEDFPFLEILDKQQVCPINVVYVVDFSADVSDLIQKTVKAPTRESSVCSISTISQKASSSRAKVPMKRTSILKHGSSLKSSRVSINLQRTSTVDASEPLINYLTCKVPPPINYGSLSEDPYLPQYLQKLKSLMYEDKQYILCYQHQVKLLANYINDLLSGPPYPGPDFMKQHCLDIHIKTLKEKLGTNLIPIGFLRYGFHCEKALLFKALADKVGIPATLVRGTKNLTFWNEVPIVNEEPFVNIEDELKSYMSYAVVDLIDNIGHLMLVGSLEADKYCRIFIDKASHEEKCPVNICHLLK